MYICSWRWGTNLRSNSAWYLKLAHRSGGDQLANCDKEEEGRAVEALELHRE